VQYVEWPADKKVIDIGSFYADSSRLRHTTGWTPRVPLADGLRQTIEFYRRHYDRYVAAGDAVNERPSAERV
jgi:nucleoside-diphosphate-sugar epimerase